MKQAICLIALTAMFIGMAEKAPNVQPAPKALAATKPGETKLVPYRLTTTKHVLVRAEFNGQGPYNLVIDTGAPVLILAKKVNEQLQIDLDKAGWGTVGQLEFEGGVVLDRATIRFDDLFQLEGMNGMGLAGIEIHGLVGYPILSQFRITYDYSEPKLTWVKLDTTIDELPRRPSRGGAPGGLDALGSVMKTLGKLFGMGPAPIPEPRGFLGFSVDVQSKQVVVRQVLNQGPAEHGGLQENDVIESINDKAVDSEETVKKALQEVRPDGKVKMVIQRSNQPVTLTITAGRGL